MYTTIKSARFIVTNALALAIVFPGTYLASGSSWGAAFMSVGAVAVTAIMPSLIEFAFPSKS